MSATTTSTRTRAATALAGLLVLSATPAWGAPRARGALPEEELAKLIAADGAPGDQVGLGISISAGRILVGAYADDVFGTDSGSAYVFRLDGQTWTQEARLVPPDGAAGDNFGLRVSLDGDLAAVGSPHSQPFGPDSGSVYVFRRTGTSWSLEAKLVSPQPAALDQFGRWISLDRERLAISCQLDDYGELVDAGSAYVFRRDGTIWSPEAWLRPPDPTGGSWFARSVALRGNTLVVGEPRHDGAGADSGRAHLFERSGGAWLWRRALLAPDGAAGDQLGAAVATSGGRVALAAIKDDHSGATDAGSVYLFRRVQTSPWGMTWPWPPHLPMRSTLWAYETKLTAFDAASGDQFGRSVAIGDGHVVASAIFDDHAGGTDAGSAYRFQRRQGLWTDDGKLVPSDPASGDLLGYTVSIGGGLVAVGCYLDDNERGVDAGSGYVFGLGSAESP